MDAELLSLWLSQQSLFKSQDLKGFIISERMTYIHLKNWLSSGRIQKLPYQYYSPVNQQTNQAVIDPYIFANHVVERGYVVGLAACFLHGFPVPKPMDITIGASKKFRRGVFNSYTYKPRLDSQRPHVTVKAGVFVTDYLDTIIEIIRDFVKLLTLPQFKDVLASLKLFSKEELIHRLQRYNTYILYQKFGYLTEAGYLSVDQREAFINYCHDRIGKSKRSLSKQSPSRQKHMSKWQLVVPSCLLPTE